MSYTDVELSEGLATAVQQVIRERDLLAETARRLTEQRNEARAVATRRKVERDDARTARLRAADQMVDEARRERDQAQAEVTGLRERLDSAVEWMGTVRDELVMAGGRGGDRVVALANLRALVKERDDAQAEVERMVRWLREELDLDVRDSVQKITLGERDAWSEAMRDYVCVAVAARRAPVHPLPARALPYHAGDHRRSRGAGAGDHRDGCER